ncbi:hypothetical protein F5Y15DRAFT_358827 [Xylariaceae sp. FL0016]|nr:hypothetical protein F5Y15DRAFT_358827 [Xylariaceae sp. FL0016]
MQWGDTDMPASAFEYRFNRRYSLPAAPESTCVCLFVCLSVCLSVYLRISGCAWTGGLSGPKPNLDCLHRLSPFLPVFLFNVMKRAGSGWLSPPTKAAADRRSNFTLTYTNHCDSRRLHLDADIIISAHLGSNRGFLPCQHPQPCLDHATPLLLGLVRVRMVLSTIRQFALRYLLVRAAVFAVASIGSMYDLHVLACLENSNPSELCLAVQCHVPG